MKPFGIKDRLKAFKYAWAGVRSLFHNEQNAWIHLVMTILMIGLGFLFAVSSTEWMALSIVTIMVWMAELFNSSVERLCDLVHADPHPLVKQSKDLAAAGVMVGAFGAIVVGVIVFVPKVAMLINW